MAILASPYDRLRTLDLDDKASVMVQLSHLTAFPQMLKII